MERQKSVFKESWAAIFQLSEDILFGAAEEGMDFKPNEKWDRHFCFSVQVQMSEVDGEVAEIKE